jgi:hypothetical protein
MDLQSNEGRQDPRLELAIDRIGATASSAEWQPKKLAEDADDPWLIPEIITAALCMGARLWWRSENGGSASPHPSQLRRQDRDRSLANVPQAQLRNRNTSDASVLSCC